MSRESFVGIDVSEDHLDLRERARPLRASRKSRRRKALRVFRHIPSAFLDKTKNGTYNHNYT